MAESKGRISDRKVKVILWIAATVFIACMGFLLDITIVVDESGTIANAAWLAGDDWNTCVKGIGGYYYKYGTVILFYPLYCLFKDSYIFYKSLMLVHAMLIAVIPVLAYEMQRRYLKVESQWMAALISELMGVFPFVVLYSLYARADAALMVIPWLVCYLLLETNRAQEEGEKKKWCLFTLLMTLAAFWGYSCHTRGMVFVIAVFLTVFVGQVFCKIRIVNWPVYLLCNLVFYLGDKQIARYFKKSIWYGMDKLHASSDSFKYEKLWEIVQTPFGFKSFVKLVLGWAFNMVTSTYGLIIIGFLAAVFVVVCAFTKKYRHRFSVPERIIAAFGLLYFLGTYLLGCLFFYSPAKRIFKGKVHGRLDRLIYGRYIAGALGILVFVAMYVLIFKSDFIKRKWKVTGILLHISVVAVFFGIIIKYVLDGVTATRYFMELTTFIKLDSWGGTTGQFPQLKRALFLAALLGLLVSVVIAVASEGGERRKRYLCTGLLVLTAALTVVNFYKIRLGRDEKLQAKITTVKNFINDMDGLYETFPYIYIDESAFAINTHQLSLRNYALVNRRVKGAADYENMLIIARRDSVSEPTGDGEIYQIEEYPYDGEKECVYVKGEELKETLAAMGYHLRVYEVPAE